MECGGRKIIFRQKKNLPWDPPEICAKDWGIQDIHRWNETRGNDVITDWWLETEGAETKMSCEEMQKDFQIGVNRYWNCKFYSSRLEKCRCAVKVHLQGKTTSFPFVVRDLGTRSWEFKEVVTNVIETVKKTRWKIISAWFKSGTGASSGFCHWWQRGREPSGGPAEVWDSPATGLRGVPSPWPGQTTLMVGVEEVYNITGGREGISRSPKGEVLKDATKSKFLSVLCMRST